VNVDPFGTNLVCVIT